VIPSSAPSGLITYFSGIRKAIGLVNANLRLEYIKDSKVLVKYVLQVLLVDSHTLVVKTEKCINGIMEALRIPSRYIRVLFIALNKARIALI